MPRNEMPGAYPGILFNLGSKEAEIICSGNANTSPMYRVFVITLVVLICTEGRKIFFFCCVSQLANTSANGKNARTVAKRATVPQNVLRDCKLLDMVIVCLFPELQHVVDPMKHPFMFFLI